MPASTRPPYAITAAGRSMAYELADMKVIDWEWPDTTIHEDCSLIVRHARTLHRLAEELCNGYQTWQGHWDEAATDAAEQKVDRLEARIAAIVASWPAVNGHPFTAEFQHDPRGAAVRICNADPTAHDRLSASDWGRRGYAVPR